MKAKIAACAMGAAMRTAAFADNLSPSSDVLGVKLGMTEGQAVETLNLRRSRRRSSRSARLSLAGRSR